MGKIADDELADKVEELEAEVEALKKRAVPESTTCLECGVGDWDIYILQTDRPAFTVDWEIIHLNRKHSHGNEPDGLRAFIAAREAIDAAEAAIAPAAEEAAE